MKITTEIGPGLSSLLYSNQQLDTQRQPSHTAPNRRSLFKNEQESKKNCFLYLSNQTHSWFSAAAMTADPLK